MTYRDSSPSSLKHVQTPLRTPSEAPNPVDALPQPSDVLRTLLGTPDALPDPATTPHAYPPAALLTSLVDHIIEGDFHLSMRKVLDIAIAIWATNPIRPRKKNPTSEEALRAYHLADLMSGMEHLRLSNERAQAVMLHVLRAFHVDPHRPAPAVPDEEDMS